jgi:hypothetical protein
MVQMQVARGETLRAHQLSSNGYLKQPAPRTVRRWCRLLVMAMSAGARAAAMWSDADYARCIARVSASERHRQWCWLIVAQLRLHGPDAASTLLCTWGTLEGAMHELGNSH